MKNNTVAVLGKPASFHDMACNLFFPDMVSKHYCESFSQLCENLHTEQVDYLVIAVENSLAGPLYDNIQLIEDYGFSFVNEVKLPINLHLIARKGTQKSDITKLSSHPVALKQCTDFLEKLEGVIVEDATDTASAAASLLLPSNEHFAALASFEVAQQYGLEIIESNVQNSKDSFTRFLLLARFNGDEATRINILNTETTLSI